MGFYGDICLTSKVNLWLFKLMPSACCWTCASGLWTSLFSSLFACLLTIHQANIILFLPDLSVSPAFESPVCQKHQRPSITMTARVSVALLKVGWILFFLTLTPLPVSAQGTGAFYSDEVDIQPPSVTSAITTSDKTDLSPPPPGPKPKTKDMFETNLSPSFLGRSEHLGNSAGPENCCFELYPRRIKKDILVSYEMTDHRCARRAALFVTQKSRRICMDPSLSWVQNIMKTLDEKSF